MLVARDKHALSQLWFLYRCGDVLRVRFIVWTPINIFWWLFILLFVSGILGLVAWVFFHPQKVTYSNVPRGVPELFACGVVGLFLFVLFLALLAPPEIDFGAEGIILRRRRLWGAQERTMRWSDIDSIKWQSAPALDVSWWDRMTCKRLRIRAGGHEIMAFPMGPWQRGVDCLDVLIAHGIVQLEPVRDRVLPDMSSD